MIIWRFYHLTKNKDIFILQVPKTNHQKPVEELEIGCSLINCYSFFIKNINISWMIFNNYLINVEFKCRPLSQRDQ